ncbi:MAG: ATP-binding protein [Bacteroidota bacterium]
MSLKVRYFLLIGLIHVLLLVLSFQLLKEQKLFFILAEFGIIVSFLLSIVLYRSFIRPLRFLYTGTNAIQDQDFGVKFVETGAREMDQLIRTYNQMIDQIRTERKESEEQHYFLQKIIQASPSGIFVFDYDGKLTDLNPKAKALFQLEATIIDDPKRQSAHTQLQALADLKAGQSELLVLEGAKRYRCESSEFVHRGFKRKFVLVQEVSKEMLEAEKHAYGKIIRMMAHEVNNSIGAINSILHSIQTFEELEKDWGKELVEALQIAIDRNSGLNQFMKNYADVIRLPKPNIQRNSIDDLCLETARLMQIQAKKRNISIEIKKPTTVVFAHFDQPQMEQVLINILKNAIESIGANGSIEIVLRSSPPQLKVRDNGKGIPDEVQKQLFTPFFSTKMNGQGVGLTLIRDILSHHQFDFSLKTQEDGWTEFLIAFY